MVSILLLHKTLQLVRTFDAPMKENLKEAWRLLSEAERDAKADLWKAGVCGWETLTYGPEELPKSAEAAGRTSLSSSTVATSVPQKTC